MRLWYSGPGVVAQFRNRLLLADFLTVRIGFNVGEVFAIDEASQILMLCR